MHINNRISRIEKSMMCSSKQIQTHRSFSSSSPCWTPSVCRRSSLLCVCVCRVRVRVWLEKLVSDRMLFVTGCCGRWWWWWLFDERAKRTVKLSEYIVTHKRTHTTHAHVRILTNTRTRTHMWCASFYIWPICARDATQTPTATPKSKL